MKKLKWVSLIIFVCLLFLAACNQSDDQEQRADEEDNTQESSTENEEIISLAETFIDQLSAGDYASATEKFDETMTSQMTAADLEELWETLNEQLGDFIDHEYNRTQPADEFQVVLLTGVFNNNDVTFQITFDNDQQIAGFYIV